MHTKNLFLTLAVLFLLISCSKKDELPPKSSLKSIKSFVIASFTPSVVGVVDTVKNTVNLTFPIGADIKNLAPTITTSPLSTISPTSETKQDFSKALSYIVTAEDGSKVTYQVSSSVQKSSENSILTFTFSALTPAVTGTIETSGTAITATVPYGTNLKNLVPTITISPRATISPASGAAKDFSSPVEYIVTAENGLTKKITITVKVEPAPVILKGRVFVGSYYLYGLNLADGKEIWKYRVSDTNDYFNTPTYYNGVVYCTSGDLTLHAINAMDGKKIWASTISAKRPTSYYAGASRSVPIVANNTVYVGSSDGNFYAFDLLTGTEKWKFQTANEIRTSPTIVNGTIYFGSTDKYLYALDAVTGKQKWNFKCDHVILSSPAVSDGIIYFGSNGAFYALDSNSGLEKWSYKVDSPITSSPTVSNQKIYVGSSDGDFYSFHLTGGVNWKKKVGDFGSSSPIVSDGQVYFCNSGLISMNISDGSIKWKIPSDGVSPVIVKGNILGVDENEQLILVQNNSNTVWKLDFSVEGSPCAVDSEGNIYQSGLSGSVQ